MLLSKHRILSYAILASLIWHLFWISALKVVISKPPQAAVKFGKVSFLGPILSRSAIELKISPRQRSILEKRYLRELEGIMASPMQRDQGARPENDVKTSPIVSDEGIKRFVEKAVAGAKLEPDRRF